jgi:hypothetical protein
VSTPFGALPPGERLPAAVVDLAAFDRNVARVAGLAHAARSNMNTQTGLATPLKFGQRGCFGTDVMSLDSLAEAQLAEQGRHGGGQHVRTA